MTSGAEEAPWGLQPKDPLGRATRSEPPRKYWLIGPDVPPLGGISVFLRRYARQLRSEGHDVELVDLTKLAPPARYLALLKLAFRRHAIFHLNFVGFAPMVAMLLNPFSPHLVFCNHGDSLNVLASSWWKRRLFSYFLGRLDQCILVGDHLLQYYDRLGLKRPENTVVQHAFLPPPLEEESKILATYEPETSRFVACRNPLIVANAYQISFANGIDLYGLDLCVELVARLTPTYPDIGLLFALAHVGDQAYFETITRRAVELGVEANVHFMTGQKELWPLFRRADLMLRPTYEDGYGISVAEALYFGCPAIASDACRRAEGTVLFRNRDLEDLFEKSKAVLGKSAARAASLRPKAG